MTTQELFEIITKIIAEPHNVITEHDKRRAIQVFLGFDDYLIDNVPDPVYVYIRQLENAIKYDTNGVKRLYPFRFGVEE